ncbi:hypothetical protein [Dapis sp. BLCC M172]|uniref:hypothetical protein n=1 Tax=Dapis sp. BLCC M172 TaxID=2975281 RepID=UPI003CE8021F
MWSDPSPQKKLENITVSIHNPNICRIGIFLSDRLRQDLEMGLEASLDMGLDMGLETRVWRPGSGDQGLETKPLRWWF